MHLLNKNNNSNKFEMFSVQFSYWQVFVHVSRWEKMYL